MSLIGHFTASRRLFGRIVHALGLDAELVLVPARHFRMPKTPRLSHSSSAPTPTGPEIGAGWKRTGEAGWRLAADRRSGLAGAVRSAPTSSVIRRWAAWGLRLEPPAEAWRSGTDRCRRRAARRRRTSFRRPHLTLPSPFSGRPLRRSDARRPCQAGPPGVREVSLCRVRGRGGAALRRPQRWIWAVMRIESRGRVRAVSPKGRDGSDADHARHLDPDCGRATGSAPMPTIPQQHPRGCAYLPRNA